MLLCSAGLRSARARVVVVAAAAASVAVQVKPAGGWATHSPARPPRLKSFVRPSLIWPIPELCYPASSQSWSPQSSRLPKPPGQLAGAIQPRSLVRNPYPAALPRNLGEGLETHLTRTRKLKPKAK